MKLLNNFFKILSLNTSENKTVVSIELNAAHEIFTGHFPGNPVVPGVCMVQIIKEILEEIYGKEFTMRSASQLKFLAVLNPLQHQAVNIELNVSGSQENELVVSGTFQKAELVFLKYKATFSAMS